ncbi:MAG TPA: thermonuclease family protein [Albitalea sp.]|uniref:thermonuclease family protein n=1 Tax=Piscinibacter sp. TaxID=1903157 RepID=UPI002ED1A2DA
MLSPLLLCTVIAVSDGDTLKARCHAAHRPSTTIAVRLAEIDAPERGQRFGQRSRRQLSALCFRQAVEVRPTVVDRYGRAVAHVRCQGADASTEQVRSGMAWVFERYTSPSSPLHALQAQARQHRRGLWVDAQPQAPWEWRRQVSREE